MLTDLYQMLCMVGMTAATLWFCYHGEPALMARLEMIRWRFSDRPRLPEHPMTLEEWEEFQDRNIL